MSDVLIVGAGHGGAQAAIGLRQLGFAGSITIVGDEPDLPYERPPLSKEYFAGDKTFDRLLFRPESFWRERSIDLILGRRIDRVDPGARTAFAEGEALTYGQLIWAAGGRPRRLTCPGSDLAGVHSVRNRADIDAILATLPGVSDVVVVGGGYIGLEAAAVLRKFGKRVTLLEAQDRVLARVAGETLSRVFEAEHRAQGVDVRLNATVIALTGQGRVTGIDLADGTHLPADLVIVGVGIRPNVEPLLAAGAEGGDGVEVDGRCRTSLPEVFAIGDCARHANRHADGARLRLESAPNALDQAMTVARELTGQGSDQDGLPWFWSNQYDLRLQTVGLCQGHDEVLTRGAPDSRSFSLLYLKAGRLIAIDCLNRARDFVQAKALIAAGGAVDRAAIRNPEVALKDASSA